MADVRIPRNTLPVPTRAPTDLARAEAARAAQRAFFQAALGEVAAAEPQVVRAQVQAQPAQPPRTADPTRLLRPGSIIDIKV